MNELKDLDPQETAEWLKAFEELVVHHGEERARFILDALRRNETPYVNSIAAGDEPAYPGDEAIEKRLRRILRWNAAMMVHRAYARNPDLGGHIATYASACTLYEVGFNHFFRGRDNGPGDLVYVQGHASPGIYARAFLEGRLAEEHLDRFRRECGGGGLSSYPHPWLMPDFWEFPTVSMGLGPLNAIYQARFNRYLAARGIKDTSGSKVWAFLGDGECDEPESLGALSIASREGLDNLIFVVNCNLQRLDGPVRGNFKIVQELEAVFRGAGWTVIKVLWSRDWDPLLESDESGLLIRRMGEVCDGEMQNYVVRPGSYVRDHFFGKYAETRTLVEHLSDQEIHGLRRGGHDVRKVYAAYQRAAGEAGGRPTVILAQTVKGWSTGRLAEGKNGAHQEKHFTEKDLRAFRDQLEIPVSDRELADPPYYRPARTGPEMEYLHERRRVLGGYVPRRSVPPATVTEKIPSLSTFEDSVLGGKDMSTTQGFNLVLRKLLDDPGLGRRIVPIVPDEARTFGWNALFGKVGIYSPVEQRYEPVDIAARESKMEYREAVDGQLLEEGINEAGALASFTAAGTAYANHGVPMIPFYIYYSMFGFQRVGDLVWAAADSRAKGFLLGATAGRTTLNGEGLQHEDGHSPLLFSVVPTCRVYDPAWSYEVAVIVRDGLHRMYQEKESCFYYLTLYNEAMRQPPMPRGVEEGIVKGLYRYRAAATAPGVQLLGSGVLLLAALRAQELLTEKFGVAADVWSVPSYVQLRREALECDRWNMLHPAGERKVPYVVAQLGPTEGPIVAVTDYMRAVPEMVARWFPDRFCALGTDGFGRSDSRAALRRHFGVAPEHIAYAALWRLSLKGKFPVEKLAGALEELSIDSSGPDPAFA